MKKCINDKCGKEIKDEDAFCPYCGIKQSTDDQISAGDTETKETNVPSDLLPGSPMNPKQLCIIAAIGILGLISIFSLVKSRTHKIDIDQYWTCSFRGYDGYGTAEFFLDGLIQEVHENGKNADGLTIPDIMTITELPDQGNLSNGDKIKVLYSYDNEKLKKYNIKLTGGKETAEVSGLQKVREVPLSDYVDVVFEGYNGYGTAISRWKYDKLQNDVQISPEEIDYYAKKELSKMDGLSNGDKLNVSFQCFDQNDIAYSGFKFTADSMECEVEGLSDVRTVSLQDYIIVDAMGYSGEANAELSLKIDKDKMAEDAEYSAVSNISSYLEIDYEKPENVIENGMEITPVIKLVNNGKEYLESLPVLYGIELNTEMSPIKVTGLNEVQVVDVFKDLDIKYGGVSPSLYIDGLDFLGRLFIPLSGYPVSGVYCTCTYENPLQIGSEITVTIDEDIMEGYKPKETVTTITVSEEEVSRYAQTLADISDETLEQIDKETKDILWARTAQWDPGSGSNLEELTLDRIMFLKKKDILQNDESYNRLYLIYKSKISNVDGTGEIYILADLDGITVDHKGHGYFNPLDIRIAENTVVIPSDGNWYYSGYTNYDDIETAWVLSIRDRYELIDDVIKSEESAK